jgi:hypothetical protein
MPSTPAPIELPTEVGRLLYLARHDRDAERKTAARAELTRRGLNPRTGLKTATTGETA